MNISSFYLHDIVQAFPYVLLYLNQNKKTDCYYYDYHVNV